MNQRIIIYRATCIETKKSYIGQTSQALRLRILGHYRHAKYYVNAHRPFYRALLKYPKKQFVWSVLETCTSDCAANTSEIGWIARLNSRVPHGYNISIGGEGGRGKNHWNFGRCLKNETKKKISNTLKKIKISDSVRTSMTEGLRNYFKNGGKPSNYGKKDSAETIRKRVMKIRGQKRTPEQIERIKEGKRKGALLRKIEHLRGRQGSDAVNLM